MMKRLLSLGIAALFVVSVALAGDGPKSGPQVGERIPGPFHCMQAKNADKPEWDGTSQCLVCQNGGRSVAMIFTREINESLTTLVKKLDGEVGKSNKKMGAFVVLLSKEETAEKRLKDFAAKEKIQNVSLAVMDNPAGPPEYNVAKDAEVTVVFYKASKVEANHAFKKGEFDTKSIEIVMSDLPKIAAK